MSYPPLKLAEAFIHAGELDDALDALNQHLALHPGDVAVERMRVQVLLRLGEPDHLRDAITSLETLDRTALDDYTLSVLYERLSTDLDAALIAARSAVDRATKTEDEHFQSRAVGRVIDLLRKSGNHAEALDISLKQDWVQLAADIAADMDDLQTAVSAYTQSLERASALYDITSSEIADNIRARILLKRAGAYQRLGDDLLADADYLAALAFIPDDPMIPFNRALIAYRRNDIAGATGRMRRAYRMANATLQQMMIDEIEMVPGLKAIWDDITRES
jgi:tetratricopeptide (TPR) repeat protein